MMTLIYDRFGMNRYMNILFIRLIKIPLMVIKEQTVGQSILLLINIFFL